MEPICISTNDPYGASLEAARAAASLVWTPPPPPGNGMGANPSIGPTGGVTGPDVPPQGQETPAGPDPATEMEEKPDECQAAETPDRTARKITPALLRRVAPGQFQFVRTYEDGEVMFAGPLPPPYGDGLEYEIDEDGRVWMSEETFYRFENAWEEYAATLPACHKRTKPNEGKFSRLSDSIAIITDRQYRHAMTLVPDKTAFIVPVSIADSLLAGNGTSDIGSFALSLDECDPEEIARLDFTLLKIIYTIILKDLEKQVKEATDPDEILRILDSPNWEYVVYLYLPEFLEKIGSKPDADENRFAIATDKLRSFEKVVGIHATKEPQGMRYKRYDVMSWISDDSGTNTVRFSSPYCNHIAKLLLKKHLKKDEAGDILMKPGGPPEISVFCSYTARSMLGSERNKMATEIVSYVIYLVESAGRGVPNATAAKILRECPQLRQRIETAKTTSEKNTYLKRAFGRAWNILRDPKYAELLEGHEDFLVPTRIPKMQTIDEKFVFSSKPEKEREKTAKKQTRH